MGSGHATMALKPGYGEQLARAQKELGLELVRFHGIFDDDVGVWYGKGKSAQRAGGSVRGVQPCSTGIWAPSDQTDGRSSPPFLRPACARISPG